jgi:ATP-dependent exoDNAse (exonuclease V) alpha subunit
MLAFAMTVHRAQGQTLQYVDIDCYSFFAAGQMGVACSVSFAARQVIQMLFKNVHIIVKIIDTRRVL